MLWQAANGQRTASHGRAEKPANGPSDLTRSTYYCTGLHFPGSERPGVRLMWDMQQGLNPGMHTGAEAEQPRVDRRTLEAGARAALLIVRWTRVDRRTRSR